MEQNVGGRVISCGALTLRQRARSDSVDLSGKCACIAVHDRLWLDTRLSTTEHSRCDSLSVHTKDEVLAQLDASRAPSDTLASSMLSTSLSTSLYELCNSESFTCCKETIVESPFAS